ncbi:hypothetical protein J6590_035706 [Homalodisca vitripennis]|nr:hypothetical protein J6590_035706 [Homalodisca vitripennis]
MSQNYVHCRRLPNVNGNTSTVCEELPIGTGSGALTLLLAVVLTNLSHSLSLIFVYIKIVTIKKAVMKE